MTNLAVRTARARVLPALLGASMAVAACGGGRGAATAASRAPTPRPDPRAGLSDSFALASAALGDTLLVRVHLPPGYDPARRYPVVYTLQSGVYFDRLALPRWVDSLAAAGGTRVLLVALPDADSLDAFRPDTPAGDAFVAALADEVTGEVERRYAARRDPAGRLLLGFSAGANVLLDLAVRRPGRFGRVAAASPGWMFVDGQGGIGTDFHAAAVRHVEAAPAGVPGTRFWFVWGDGAGEWETRSRANGAAVMGALRARGAAVVDGGTVPGDHGLALARATLPPALAFLLGARPGEG